MYVHSYKQKPIRLHFVQIYAETYCRRVGFAIKYKYKYIKNTCIYSLHEGGASKKGKNLLRSLFMSRSTHACPQKFNPSCDPVSLKGQFQEIFCFWFFSWISFLQPQSIPLGLFRIFSKICGDIHKSRTQGATPVSTTPVANLPPVSMTPVAKLLPVSTTPAANLPPVLLVLLIPVANLPPVSTIPAASFATGFNDTGGNGNNVRLLRP